MSRIYPNAVARTASDIAGERVSVFTFGAVGDGVTDDSTAVKNGIANIISLGGGSLYFPGGYTYNLASMIPFTSSVPIILEGDGEGSIILRGAAIAVGSGWFDILAGSNIRFRQLTFDGAVTTPTGILYSTFGSNPYSTMLTTNSTFWIHPGSSEITFESCIIQHTGGYACLIDATTANTTDISFADCIIRQNRPFLFGVSSGDLNYGSWAGGIFAYGLCTSSNPYSVQRFKVQNCKFLRNTGNCLWSSCTAFYVYHTGFQWTDCFFEDCGLDAFELGNVYGGEIGHMSGHRIGYITTTDVSTPSPAYLSGLYATFGDHSGYVESVTYGPMNVTSVNGDAYNLDGLRNVTLTSLTADIAVSGTPIYTEDNIALYGPGQNGVLSGRGISTGNTQQNGGAQNINIISPRISGFGYSSILLTAAKYCKVSSAHITQPNSSAEAPIQIFSQSGGSGNELLCMENIIEHCLINFTGSFPCIEETGAGWTTSAINRVFDNQCYGTNNGEFLPMVVSGAQVSGSLQGFSIVGQTPITYAGGTYGGLTITTNLLANSNLSYTGNAPMFIRDIGSTAITSQQAAIEFGLTGSGTANIGAGPSLLMFSNNSASVRSFMGRVSSVWDNATSGSEAASLVFSVRANSADTFAQTIAMVITNNGLISIGTSVEIDQAGNISFSGTTTGNGASSGLNVQGTAFNAIQASVGGIYAAGTSVGITNDGPYFSKSTATPPTESTTAYGALLHKSGTNWNLYNPSTTSWTTINLAASAVVGSDTEVIYNKGGSAYFADGNLIWEYSSQVLQVTAISSSLFGIYSKTGYILSDGGFNTGSTASTAINALSGGVTALSLISIRNDGISGITLARTTSTARDYGFAINASGTFLLNDDTATAVRMSVTTAGLFTFGSTVEIDQSGNITFTGQVTGSGTSAALSIQGTAFNAIQTTAGGIYCAATTLGITNDGPYFSKSTSSPPSESTTTYGALLHKSGSVWNYWNPSTTSWSTIDLATSGGSPGSPSTSVQYNNGGVFAGSANFEWNNSGQVLTVTAASSSVAGIVCGTGFIQSTTGFYSPGTAYNTVNIPSGGVLAATVAVGAPIAGRTEPFQISESYGSVALQSTSASQYTGLNMLDNSGNIAGSFQYGNPSAPSYANVFFFAARNSTAIMSFYTNGSNSSLGNEQLRIKANGEIAIISGQITLTPISSAINGTNGAIYYNSSTNLFQFYQNGTFVGLGGSGVTSLTANTGISVSASTGAITITNTGVTSLSAGTGVSISASTGSVTVSIGQAVGTGNSVTFQAISCTSLTASSTVQSTLSGSSICWQGGSGTSEIDGNGNISGGGICNMTNGYKVNGSIVINSSGAFIGPGVACQSSGIGGGGFNPWNGSGYDTGQTVTVNFSGGFTISSTTYHNLIFVGGVLVSYS
jgi:hypothetical protein